MIVLNCEPNSFSFLGKILVSSYSNFISFNNDELEVPSIAGVDFLVPNRDMAHTQSEKLDSHIVFSSLARHGMSALNLYLRVQVEDVDDVWLFGSEKGEDGDSLGSVCRRKRVLDLQRRNNIDGNLS